MEEIKNEIEEEKSQRWITVLLIIGNLIIWTIIMLFISVAKVSAASIDYDNTSNYIHRKTPTQEWLNFSRATDYSLSSTATYDQVNIQWTNYQGGVANGVVVITITGGTITTATCGQLYSAFSVKENGTDTGATITRTECIINSTSATVRIGFVTSVLGTNSYLEVQFRKEFMLATKINAYGVMTVKQIDPATNTDIQDQTNALINNNNSNTQIITNAVENSTTNIINQMQDNLKICTNYNNLNGPVGTENKYLNTSGVEMSDTNWNISDYIKVQNGKTYTLTTDYNPYQASYCLYDNNKTQISCTRNPNVGSLTFTPNQEGYVRFSINALTGRITRLTGEYCQDRTQAEIEELWVLQQLMHTTPWEEVEPDSEEFDRTHEMENDILDMADDIDLDDVDVDLDTESSNWVWTTLTTLLNTHEKVFGMVISILSVGVIKLLLNR